MSENKINPGEILNYELDGIKIRLRSIVSVLAALGAMLWWISTEFNTIKSEIAALDKTSAQLVVSVDAMQDRLRVVSTDIVRGTADRATFQPLINELEKDAVNMDRKLERHDDRIREIERIMDRLTSE